MSNVLSNALCYVLYIETLTFNVLKYYDDTVISTQVE